MSLSRVVKGVALSFAVAVTIIGLTPNSASAGFGNCPIPHSFYVCVFKNINGVLPMYYYTLGDGISVGPGHCVEIGGSWDNNIESVYNDTQYVLYAYISHGCAGGVVLTNPLTARNFTEEFANSISSIELLHQ